MEKSCIFGYWPGQVPRQYHAATDASGGQFLFANASGPNGYVVTVRFRIGEAQDRLYSFYTAPRAGERNGLTTNSYDQSLPGMPGNARMGPEDRQTQTKIGQNADVSPTS